MDGWKCPVCGAGLAPHVSRCTHGFDGDAKSAPYFPTIPYSPSMVMQLQKCDGCGSWHNGLHAFVTCKASDSTERVGDYGTVVS